MRFVRIVGPTAAVLLLAACGGTAHTGLGIPKGGSASTTISSATTTAPSPSTTTTLPSPPAALGPGLAALDAQSAAFSQAISNGQAAAQVKTSLAVSTADYVNAVKIGTAATSGIESTTAQLAAYVQTLQTAGSAPIGLVADVSSLKQTAATMAAALAPIPAKLAAADHVVYLQGVAALIGVEKDFTAAVDVLTAFKNQA